MSKLHFQPVKGQARDILDAILESPEVASCNMTTTMALRLACEEIVMNVTTYAYLPDEEGWLDIDIEKTDRITIRFEDGGVSFNPLEQEKPDTGLSWKKRSIGGLGIFILRRKMDDVRYVYENNRNILTIEKYI
ncbi:MAG: ATP-binding protein [Bacteroidaceae bacterium]|nr:ATP-binding protein [Bacteroidaceae bacterium]